METKPVMETRVWKWYVEELCLMTIPTPPHSQKLDKHKSRNKHKKDKSLHPENVIVSTAPQT